MPARPSLPVSARLSGGASALAAIFATTLAAAEPTSPGTAEAKPEVAAQAKPEAKPEAKAEAKPEANAAPLDPATMRLGIALGPSVRLGEAPAYPITERAGPALAVSAAIAPSSLFEVALAYERVGLGREHSADPTTGDWVDVARALDAVWASVALRLVRAPEARLSLVVGASLLWQQADASGALSQGEGAALSTFRCSAGDSVNFGFRAGLGGEVTLGSGFLLLADALLDNVRLSSGALGSCVSGAGTTALFSARLGFAYRFDVSRFVR